MLSLLAAGYALPPALIDNALLSRLDGRLSDAVIEQLSGVRQRRTSLPLEYVVETGNQDPSQALKNSTLSPSMLGAQAARHALEQAGITAADVGLILGDTVTPYEVCPSEAPRIGHELAVKVPAYDILGSAASLAYQLESLSCWKPQRLPKYILCISTNTPTHYVDYRDGVARTMFGDGAVAFLISPTEAGAFTIERASAQKYSDEPGGRFPLNAHVEVHEQKLAEFTQRTAQALITESGVSLSDSETGVIWPQVAPRLLGAVPAEHAAQTMSCAATTGDTIGAGPGIALAQEWQKALGFKRVVMLATGLGGSGGFIVLKRQ